MAYSSEIYMQSTDTTYDISARTRGIQITKMLDSALTVFKLNCRAIALSHLFHKMTVKDSGTDMISGIITGQSDRSSRTDKETVFTCIDWGYFLAKRIVNKKYTSQLASAILEDMFSTYAADFTTTNVDESTAIITDALFQYMPLRDCLEYIMDMSPDWHYYIDKDKDLHFFYIYESDGPAITQSNIHIDTLQVDYEGIDHYNRVWIVGSKQAAASAIDVYYTADGTQRYFGPLPYEPNSLSIHFTPTGLPEYEYSIALEQDDDGSSYEMLYTPKSRVIYYPSYESPGTGVIRCNFKPLRQFIDYFENADDIADYGLMEKAVKNVTITDKIEARRYGTAEVTRASEIKRILRFQTDDTNHLAADLGERCAVSISSGDWSISGNFLITGIVDTIADNYLIRQLELKEL
jgi:hypothetical protein